MGLTIQKQPEIFVLTGNPVEFVISSDTVVSSNHKIHVQIAERVGVGEVAIDYNVLAEEALPVINNSVTFDISDYLKKTEKADFNIFDFFEKKPRAFKDISYYSVRFFETYNNDGITHNATSYQTIFFTQGGFSNIFLKNFKSESRSFYQEWLTNDLRKFLTWSPQKKITPYQHDVLFFLHNESVVYYKIVLYFDDDTTQEIDSEQTTFGTQRYFAWINSSFLANELSNYETLSKKVVYYTIQLFNGADVANSELIIYYIDRNNYNYGRQFIFKNSLGGYDTIYLKGVSEQTNEVERTVGYFDTKNQTSFSEFIETYQVASGFLVNSYKSVKEAQQYITELFNSTEIYEIVGKEIVSVIPTTKKVNIKIDNEFLYSFEFEYEYAYSDQFFSPLDREQFLDPRIFYKNGDITPDPVNAGFMATLDFDAMINAANTISFEINWGADVGITYINDEVFVKDVWKSLQTQISIPGNVSGTRTAVITDSLGGRYQIGYQVGDLTMLFEDGEPMLFEDGEQMLFEN